MVIEKMSVEQQAAFLAALDEALCDAHIPSLIASLVHLSGDASLLASAPRPLYERFDDKQGDLPLDVQAQARDATIAAVARLIRGDPAPPPPDEATLRTMMDFVAGADLPERYVPLLEEQLAVDGRDRREPDWSAPELKRAAANAHVLIIGAGMSGLLAAIRLQQAGIGYEIVEKSGGVGGTWRFNTYPGCRVDTPNHLYSFSFEKNHAWPSHFSRQGVLLDYFERIASERELSERISFHSEATALRFDEEVRLWRATVRHVDGTERVIAATHVISAVGQLNEPKMPDIPGMDCFAGASFHSARWEHGVDLAGRRVAVIGTGASAFQFVPEIAKEAGEVVIFQRSPPWLVPTYEYHDEVPAGASWLIENLPFYGKWYRFRLFWKMTEGIFEAVTADPEWRGPENAIGEQSAAVRQFLVQEIARQCGGDQALMDVVIPTYPFGGKRPLRDNGQWIATLKRDNVQVVTSKIEEIVSEGIRTADGVTHEADVLIYGTGFHASDFLKTVDVRGVGGVHLYDVWAGDARAYLGISVPGFPNLFVMYGPNTNIAVNGSIIFLMECAASYIVDCMKLSAERGGSTIEVREDVYERYNNEIDAANLQRAWGAPQSQSWYKSASGRVSQNWPHRLVDYWIATRRADPGDFRFGEAAGSRMESEAHAA